MSTLDLKAYEIFKSKLGEKEAEIVIEYFESKTESKFQEKKEVLATKGDLHELRDATKDDIALVRQEALTTKVDLIKWMVGLWLAQMAAIVGLYLTR